MIKNNYGLHEQSLDLYFQVRGFSSERSKYQAFKNGKLTTFDYGNDIDFSILMILEKLGFSSNEIGTYVYKNLIKKIIYMINDGVMEEEILASLMKNHSQLYLDVAYDTDIGTKTLHSYIDKAVSKINVNNVDENLETRIYGDNQTFHYGLDAYIIANYVNDSFNLYKNDNKGTKVRVLGNR